MFGLLPVFVTFDHKKLGFFICKPKPIPKADKTKLKSEIVNVLANKGYKEGHSPLVETFMLVETLRDRSFLKCVLIMVTSKLYSNFENLVQNDLKTNPSSFK